MPVENLVEEVAAVMGGQLGMPDQPVDLPHPQGLHRVLAVINAEALLEINGILLYLVPN